MIRGHLREPMCTPLHAKMGEGYSHDIAADGQRFLINTLVEGNNPATELKR